MREYTHEERKALRENDWSANVADEFKDLTSQEIKLELDKRRNGLVIGFENCLRDFNFSALIRAVNAFSCSSVVYTGFRKYDPRGAVGTVHYENVYWFEEDFSLIISNMRHLGYRIVAAELTDEAVPLKSYHWQEDTFLILGEESIGIDQKILDLVDDVVYIEMTGSVRSLNVASAGHIMIYDYLGKTGRL